MPLIEDKTLPLAAATSDQVRDFQIAWLNRRVENLEAIVFELLRGRVNYEGLEGYKKTLANPGFGPTSAFLKDCGSRFAWEAQQAWPEENLGWPPVSKPDSDVE